MEEYSTLFKGLGRLKDNYAIRLKEDAKPFSLTTPRRIALPFFPKVKEELQRMQDAGVISKVEQPTQWCAGMVVVPKPDGKVRICVDLTKLNENIYRERHILPSVEQTLARIGGATFFSKLDANSGFWQVELAPESSLLTTFITPFGRFCFNRMPFRITSAPEHFQRRMSNIVEDLEGVVCMVDDILVFAKTQEDHDRCLRAVLNRIKDAGLTLNKDKCVFNQRSVKFLGQVIDEQGIRPDPDKVSAVLKMKPPSTTTEVRRFLGMANQLTKFSPHLADKMKPLRELLSTRNAFVWGADQDMAFRAIKQALSSGEMLARYDTNLETSLSADASSYGLGAVLRQKQPGGEWHPTAYISRAMSKAEEKYVQIEKEALASTWACERLQEFLLGKRFHIETDHKPLIPLLSSKPLDELPLRVQRFRLRLMRFDFSIAHVPGKDLCTADTLSRTPVVGPSTSDHTFQQEVQAFLDVVTDNLPATDNRLSEIRSQQEQDPICQQLKQFCTQGWPHRSQVRGPLKAYLPVQSELSVYKDLLMRGSRMIIPQALRQSILEKLHSGHQGTTKCLARSRQSVWWPGIRREILEMVDKCPICYKHRSQKAEPLLPTQFPERPWQFVGSDLFEWKSSPYLLVVDYHSRFIEIAKLSSTGSQAIVTHMKSIFARHGIPEALRSDNGPQYSADLFSQFADEYGFVHNPSSPKYPQSNGEAERAVQTIKTLLTKNNDPYLALLAYRSTPLENGYSPAELLMGRKIRTTVPMAPSQLIPSLPKKSQLREKER